MSVASAARAKNAVSGKPEKLIDRADPVYELIALDAIVEDSSNPRLETKASKAAFLELVASIKANDVQQAIKVFESGPGEYHVVFGSRRIAAARAAGLALIPAVIMDHTPDAAERQRLRAIENLHRSDLNAAEECLQALSLVEACGGDVKRAAAELGVSETWIRDRLYIDRLCTPVRDMLAARLVNLGQAREIAKCGDQERQIFHAGQAKVDPEKPNQRFHTPAEIRGWIDNDKRSLRIVGWELDQPFAGKPACVGCPNNTQTDRAFFDTSKEEAEKGCCLSDSCFQAKSKAVVKAEEKLVAGLKADVKSKRVEKGNAGNAALIAERAPEFLKTSRAVRTVKAALDIQPPPATAGKGAAKKAEPADKNPYKKPLLAWGEAIDKWRDAQIGQMMKVAEQDPRFALLLAVIHATDIIDGAEFETPNEHDFNPNTYDKSWQKLKAPKPEKPPGAQTIASLDPARSLSYEGLVELAKRIPKDTGYWGKVGPALMTRLANAFGFQPPPPPAYEDFLPQELRAVASGQAGASGQSSVVSGKNAAITLGAKMRWKNTGRTVTIGVVEASQGKGKAKVQILFPEGGSGWADPSELEPFLDAAPKGKKARKKAAVEKPADDDDFESGAIDGDDEA